MGADTAYNYEHQAEADGSPCLSQGARSESRSVIHVGRERGSMADEEMEVYPIDHKGKVYSIITAFDMTFREVRGMLDWLAERNAFLRTPDAEFLGPGKMYTCEVEGVELEVDVQGYEVVVYKRNPA